MSGPNQTLWIRITLQRFPSLLETDTTQRRRTPTKVIWLDRGICVALGKGENCAKHANLWRSEVSLWESVIAFYHEVSRD